MCGVSGIYERDGRPVDAEKLAWMTDLQRHRGPDDRGVWIGGPHGNIGLGHRRLAIVDLSPQGACPMHDVDERAVITYNGEVYNYRELRAELVDKGFSFKSDSDTEVILNAYLAWDLDFVHRLNGMFAMAIWDRALQRLVLVRDRFGVKPLYLRAEGARLSFASEIKPLLSTTGSNRPDLDRLAASLFAHVSDHGDRTMFADVAQLPAGHLLVADADGVLTRRWFQLEPEQDLPGSGPELIERFRELFTDAVNLRLRSDVPVGSCLSGGIDSSSIVLVMDQLRRRGAPDSVAVRTFSAAFDVPGTDERPYQQVVQEAAGALPHLVCPDAGVIASDLDAVVWHQDEPFASPSVSAQYCVMRLAREAGVPVLLDGQGGDELLAGYDPHWAPYLYDLVRGGHLADAAWELVHGRRLLGPGALLRPVADAAPEALHRLLWPAVRPKQFPGLRMPAAAVPRGLGGDVTLAGGRRLDRTLAADVSVVRLPGLLHYEDRNSMAHSVESRTPFLDYRLVQLALALPIELKRHRGETKVALRRAMGSLLPDQVANRRDKIGFATPAAALLADQRLADRIECALASPELDRIPFFHRAEARAAWRSFKHGNTRLAVPMWKLLTLESWARQFQVAA